MMNPEEINEMLDSLTDKDEMSPEEEQHFDSLSEEEQVEGMLANFEAVGIPRSVMLACYRAGGQSWCMVLDAFEDLGEEVAVRLAKNDPGALLDKVFSAYARHLEATTKIDPKAEATLKQAKNLFGSYEELYNALKKLGPGASRDDVRAMVEEAKEKQARKNQGDMGV